MQIGGRGIAKCGQRSSSCLLVQLGRFEAPQWGARPDFDPMANRIPASKHGGSGRSGKQFPGSVDLANTCTPGAGPSPFPTGANGRSPVHLLAYLAGNDVPAARVQGVVPPTSLATFAHVFVQLPVWPSTRHSLAGVLGRRGFSLESAAARVCRDLLPLDHLDNRRLEVVVDGLPLFRGAQLAIDTTMVSAVRSDGTARRQCATTSGAALDQARRRQERTYPELAQPHGRARLVVLGCEVGRRWSEESRQFLAELAATKARSEPEVMHSWLRRWSTLMACTAARAFALSLLERRCCTAADGPTPTTAEVVADHFLDRE